MMPAARLALPLLLLAFLAVCKEYSPETHPESDGYYIRVDFIQKKRGLRKRFLTRFIRTNALTSTFPMERLFNITP